jgi:hypothetical protein
MMWQLIAMRLSAWAPATFTGTADSAQTVSTTWQSWLPQSSLVRIQAASRVLCSMARDGVITCGPDVTAEEVARAWACSVSPTLPGCVKP